MNILQYSFIVKCLIDSNTNLLIGKSYLIGCTFCNFSNFTRQATTGKVFNKYIVMTIIRHGS